MWIITDCPAGCCSEQPTCSQPTMVAGSSAEKSIGVASFVSRIRLLATYEAGILQYTIGVKIRPPQQDQPPRQMRRLLPLGSLGGLEGTTERRWRHA